MASKARKSSLPARPNLEHLRKQAKKLLEKRRAPDFRLADALLAVARKQGFASWPRLARHVETLRALEGEWAFDSLEIDGAAMPAAAFGASRMLIDGDRFRMESPEANYDGTFDIDVEQSPAQIDIEFVEGPEAGESSQGIFKLDGDRLMFCLGVVGASRPETFATKKNSGHALERLHRVSAARPVGVDGGKRRASPPSSGAEASSAPTGTTGAEASSAPGTTSESDFALTKSATLDKLQGEWLPVSLITDGKPLQESFLPYGSRTQTGNETKVVFGGQPMVHALMRIDDAASPIAIDYLNIGKGARVVSSGVLQWIADDVQICMAKPGQPRPKDFSCEAGSGRTLSRWKKK